MATGGGGAGGDMGTGDGGVTGSGDMGGGATCTSTTIETMPASGGGAVDEATFGNGAARDIGAIDGGHTRGRMFTDAHGLWAIDVGCLEHYDPSTKKFVTLSCTNVGFYQLAQDDGGFYGTGDDGVIRRVAKSDGSVTTLSAAPHQYVGGIAVSGSYVYLAGDGHILRVTTSGGPEVVIVQNAAGAHQIVADSGHVY